MFKRLVPIIALALSPAVARAAYPSTDPLLAAGTIAGFSSVYDYQTSSYHCAYIDMAAGKVIYKSLAADGSVLATAVAEQVSLTQENSELYGTTSIDFDSNSRPVVAYTRLQSSTRSVRIARWSGSAWVDTEVAGGGIHSNKLSLALFDRDATRWRLAYVNYTQQTLKLASPGSESTTVVELPQPNDVGVHLLYSANSGSLTYRDPATGSLVFANLADSGTGTVMVGSPQDVDFSADVGAQLHAQPGPGGWPNFVYLDRDSGAVKRAYRKPDFSWEHETVIRPTFGTLANPTLAFDAHGTPMVACTDTAGDRIRFAAAVGGRWYEDSIDLNHFYSRPLFLSPQAAGGFRLFAVGQIAGFASMHLRQFGPIDDFVDADKDGVPLRFEQAFMMNPAVADPEKLPVLSRRSIGGQPRIMLTLRTQPGGSANGGSGYQTADHSIIVQASQDLVNWNSNPSIILTGDVFTLSGVRYAESYLADPVGTPGAFRFLRVKVERR